MSLALLALVAALVCYAAAAAQAVTGFGFALVAVPLLALLVDPATAVVATTVTGLALTSLAAYRERRDVVPGVAARMTVGGLLGLPLGLWLLTRLDAGDLTVLIALVIVGLVGLLWLRVPVPGGAGAQWTAGLASGALLTSTGMNGPPLVLTLQARQLPPRQFRGTLQAVFWCQDLAAVAAFVLLGHVDPQVLVLVLAGVAAIPAGWRTGDRLFARISPERFRRLILVVLLLTAAASLGTALA